MNTPAIEIQNLVHRYGRSNAVNGLNLTVNQGQCYGFFGRNGSGKTTTIKCLLNLLRPASGQIDIFGMDPQKSEAEVKSRLAYVPDFVAFYPWMSVREALDYQRAFRKHWNSEMERELLQRFQLDPAQPTNGLSKGQRTQLALIGAIASEPELLVLDEPTSGLDPLVRKEFIQTVIGTYQESSPGKRTVFLSTHLITEFEGLIDRFTIIDQGKEVITLDADEARSKFRRVRATFETHAPPESEFRAAKLVQSKGRSIEMVVNGNADEMIGKLKALNPANLETESLTLEDIFLVSVKP